MSRELTAEEAYESMRGAYFRHRRDDTYLSLYFEDDYVEIDMGRLEPFSGDHILLDVPAITSLIDALTQMRAAITEPTA